MYQTIAISPLVFEQLCHEDTDTPTILSWFTSIGSETILCDKEGNILDEYENILNENTNLVVKSIFKDYLNKSSFKKIKKVNNVIKSVRDKKQLTNLETEFALIESNINWKIILTDSTTKLKFSFNNDSNSFELASPNDYISPDEESLIVSKEGSYISKERGDSFNLIKWIRKFFISTKNITLYDGYLSTKWALINLDNLFASISIIDREISFTIISMTDKARNKHNDESDNVNIESKLKYLQKKYKLVNLSISLLDEKLDINERKLITDNFFIGLGHSFEAIRENNKVYKQFNIQVSQIKNI